MWVWVRVWGEGEGEGEGGGVGEGESYRHAPVGGEQRQLMDGHVLEHPLRVTLPTVSRSVGACVCE